MPAGVGKRLSPEERADVIRRYQNGESSEALAEVFGVTGVAIRAHLRRAGIERRDASTCHRIYKVDEHAFDALTPESCYWLGMMITDGSVYSDGGTPRIEMQLALIDKDHVEKFRDFVKSDAPIRKKFNKKTKTWSAIYSVRSQWMADTLKRWGVTQRKTFTATAHPLLRDSSAFWRGVTDGDGGIKDDGNFPGVRVLGTEALCRQLKVFWSAYVDPARIHVAPIRSVFYVEVGGNDALRVLTMMYAAEKPSLQRKLETVKRLQMKYRSRVFRKLPPRRKQG